MTLQQWHEILNPFIQTMLKCWKSNQFSALKKYVYLWLSIKKVELNKTPRSLHKYCYFVCVTRFRVHVPHARKDKHWATKHELDAEQETQSTVEHSTLIIAKYRVTWSDMLQLVSPYK